MLIDIHGHIGRILPDRREFIDVTNLIAKMDAAKARNKPIDGHAPGLRGEPAAGLGQEHAAIGPLLHEAVLAQALQIGRAHV